jgi:Lipocalin-like domain
MKQLISLTTAALLASLLLPQGNAAAQTAHDQFRGSSWRLISARFERGGRKVRLIAPGLQGFLMFDSNDHFLVAITRSGLSKSAPNPGQVLQRSISCFGTYSINDGDHTIKVHIEGSTFPKWTGTDQQRLFTLTGDKLKWTNSTSVDAAGTAELVWQRVR